MLHEHSLTRHFSRIGADFRLKIATVRWNSSWGLDLVQTKRGQVFELRVSPDMLDSVQAVPAHVVPKDRHLLLLVRSGEGTVVNRYLCGHDEREWFIAAIPGKASTVAEAKEALKPDEVKEAVAAAGLRLKKRNRRHNPAFQRQGEWFFIPAPGLSTEDKAICRNEPLQRGAGKPHIAEEVYRKGGEVVYLRGIRTWTYEEVVKYREEHPGTRWDFWGTRVLNAEVFARGAVRHSDHATLLLRGWHRVLPNTEAQASAEARNRLQFLD